MRLTKDINDEVAYVQHSYRLQEKEAEIPKVGLNHLEVIQKRRITYKPRKLIYNYSST